MNSIKALHSSAYPTEGPRWFTRVWLHTQKRPAMVEWASEEQCEQQASIARVGSPFLSPADIARIDIVVVKDRDEPHDEEIVESHRHLPEEDVWLIRVGGFQWLVNTD